MGIVKYLNKAIYIIGLLAIFSVIYLVSFNIIKNKIIHPYESENVFEKHRIRPFYNVVYYPLRWVEKNNWSLKEETLENHYGTVHEIQKDSITLIKQDKMYHSIGFVPKVEITEKYKKIQIGDYVKLITGSTLSNEYDGFINTLEDVEIIDLMKDPRMPTIDLSKEKRNLLNEEFNEMKGKDRKCTRDFIKSYQDKVIKHCLQMGYAENIGGGCYHVAGYSIHSAVIKESIKYCLSKTE